MIYLPGAPASFPSFFFYRIRRARKRKEEEKERKNKADKAKVRQGAGGINAFKIYPGPTPQLGVIVQMIQDCCPGAFIVTLVLWVFITYRKKAPNCDMRPLFPDSFPGRYRSV